MTARPRAEAPGLHEVVAVWVVLALIAVATVLTYARVPAAELWNVSEEGLRGGLGRALVFLNFPAGLIVVAVVVAVADRHRRAALDGLAVSAVLLCASVGLPGVVEEHDLDAKAANLVPALGVALGAALTLVALRRHGLGRAGPWTRGDAVRALLAALLVVAALPWWFAELGFYVSDVPWLGGIFLASEVVPEPGHPDLRAVHLGRHHGTDGVLFALAALVLSRVPPRMTRRRLRVALAAYLSVMLVYGLANALEDFWLEQLVKREAVSGKLPSMLRPEATLAWAAVLVAAALVYALLFRPRRPAL